MQRNIHTSVTANITARHESNCSFLRYALIFDPDIEVQAAGKDLRYVYRLIKCIINILPLKVGDVSSHAEVDANSDEHKLREFVKKIIHKIKTTPGNDRCVDCGRPGNLHWTYSFTDFFQF